MNYSIQKEKIGIFSSLIILLDLSLIICIHLLRERHHTLTPIPRFLIGIAPNFFASLAISFLMLLLIDILPNKLTKLDTKILIDHLLIYATSSFILLTIWELLQKLFWNYPIDIFDIMASLAASVLSYAIGLIFISLNKTNNS